MNSGATQGSNRWGSCCCWTRTPVRLDSRYFGQSGRMEWRWMNFRWRTSASLSLSWIFEGLLEPYSSRVQATLIR